MCTPKLPTYLCRGGAQKVKFQLRGTPLSSGVCVPGKNIAIVRKVSAHKLIWFRCEEWIVGGGFLLDSSGGDD